MSRATQISDRKRIEAFFRDLFRADPAIGGGTAEALARRCASHIKRVVVWDDARAADEAEARGADTHPPQPAPAAGVAAAAEPAVTAAAAFDPYAFSAVVILTKTGKDGLLKRLAEIDRPEHLRKLADAQHLAVDPALTSAAELRAAIVKAAEARIANRRAAAS